MNPSLIRAYLNGRSLIHSMFSERRPPTQMPDDLAAEFTLDHRIPTIRWYINDAVSRPLKWTKRQAAANYRKVEGKRKRYYGKTDTYLYEALEKYSIREKSVVIVGSESPWYECICTYYGAKVTTVEYRQVHCDIPGLTVLTPGEFEGQTEKFDVVLSISSIEHDGLGRYGDSLNPTGDFEAMEQFKELLKPDGTLILAVPIGSDAVVWNAHRIYGRLRLPMLLDGWNVVDSFGFREDLFDAELGRWDLQPVWVLNANGTSQ